MSKQHTLAQTLKSKAENFRIGIIGAMDEEVTQLKASLESLEAHNIAGYELYTGTLRGHQVVLLKSGIGKVNAAIGTTLLLQQFQPDCVINTGSAGGFDPQLNVGDVIIGSEVRHHDVDVTIFNYEFGQVPGQPAAFLSDPFLADTAERCVSKQQGIQVARGLIATGDCFMHDPTRVQETRERFPEMKAVEMEAAAIAQTCHQFETPFLIIRALSDIAGKQSNLSFEQFLETAAKHSAEMVMDIVEALDGAQA